MTVKFAKMQDSVRIVDLDNGYVNVFICLNQVETVENSNINENNTDETKEICYEYDYNEFKEKKEYIDLDDINSNPEKYLNYSPVPTYSINTKESIEQIKEIKINEMSNASNIAIVSGADITLSNGETHHYSFETHDQTKILSLGMLAKTASLLESLGIETGETGKDYEWHHDGGDCIYYSREDIMKVAIVLQETIKYHNSYFHSLREYIKDLNSIPEINMIYYGVEVPQKYWNEVYQDSVANINN